MYKYMIVYLTTLKVFCIAIVIFLSIPLNKLFKLTMNYAMEALLKFRVVATIEDTEVCSWEGDKILKN